MKTEKRYCSKCGAEMIVGISGQSYNHNTKKMENDYYYKCPKYKSSFLFTNGHESNDPKDNSIGW